MMGSQNQLPRREFLRTTAGAVVAGGAASLMVTADRAAAQQQPPATEPVRQADVRSSAGREFTNFNPLAEKGIPVERQARDWKELTEFQYNKNEVHPYTRCRIITMNGIEVAATLFKHQMHRHATDMGLREKLALSRRIEQQQQKRVNGLIPANEHTLEVTIGYEQVAVDLTAWLAQNEPNSYVKAALDFALLEDFDHLYRYANVLDMKKDGFMKPEAIVGKLTEIMPGRPTPVEHRHPFDGVRRWIDFNTAAPQTLMNIMTIVAAEQQTMNFYMNVNSRAEEEVLRGLYNEIGMIEEQHVTHYGSLMDPNCPWLKCMVLHELHECYMYYSFALQEVDPKVKKIWETYLDMEIGHLHDAVDTYKQFARQDPAEFLPLTLPMPITFQSNIDYVRNILENYVNLTTKGTEYVNIKDVPKDDRYYQWRTAVNGDWIPSIVSVQEHIDKQGEDYRFMTKEYPFEAFRDRKQPSGNYAGEKLG